MAGILDRYQDALLLSLKGPLHFQMAPSCYDRKAWEQMGDCRAELIREANRCLSEPIPALTFSDYLAYRDLNDQSSYAEAYDVRRDMLSSLTMGMCADPAQGYAFRLAELIWAISEESSWVLPAANALNPDDLPLPEVALPLVDEGAARTACELSLAVMIAGDGLNQISPQIVRRVEWEIERRVIEPFLMYGDLNWMRGPRSDAFRCLSGTMMAFLTFERDDRRRWQCMRKAWQLLNSLLMQLSPDGSILSGLQSWQDIAGCVMDALTMVYVASDGEVDARREISIQRMCHFPAACHIAGGWFVNPGERLMKPSLDGIEVYRIGVLAQDALMCDLGTFLFKTEEHQRRERAPLTYRVFEALNRPQIEREPLNPPRLLQAYLPGLQLMTARLSEDDDRGPAIMFHGGDNGAVDSHMDVGDLIAFFGGEPVLVDAGCFNSTELHNLPTVGGMGQSLGSLGHAVDVSCRLEREYAMMSMNLMRAYPAEAGVYNWQRTAILTRADRGVQLIDVFDLKLPNPVEFHFLTPSQPSLGDGYAQIGAVRLRWEPGLMGSLREVPVSGLAAAAIWGPQLYVIDLVTQQPVKGGKFTFSLKEIRTYGS